MIAGAMLLSDDVGERLGGEHNRDILLAQHLQPFADARGEQGIVEEHPGFVEDEQGRAAVEPLLEPVEQIGEHRKDRRCVAHQRFGLEAMDVGEGEPVLGGVEQPPERALERVGQERGLERVRLEQQRQAGEGPLARAARRRG